MNKILLVFSVVVIILIVGLCILPHFFTPDGITQYTDFFDYSSKPTINWNDSSHEFKFNQKITSVDNQDFKDINIDLLFYNHGKLIGNKSSEINQTENGAFDLNLTIKLDSQPDAFYYNVTDLNWA